MISPHTGDRCVHRAAGSVVCRSELSLLLSRLSNYTVLSNTYGRRMDGLKPRPQLASPAPPSWRAIVGRVGASRAGRLERAAGMPQRMRSIALHRLGRVPYARSQALQRELVQLRRRGEVRDTLLLVEHPPVFTLGRLQSCEANVRATREEIEAAGASVVQSERGGNVTFHGPGQLVAYPILDLNGHRKDMRWFVHSLEDAMIATAAAFGVTARRGVAGEEGIWVDDRKLGALGVHVSRWVTSHGLALNVDPDLRFFDMIVPCGLHRPVTSLAREVAAGRRATLAEATTQFEAAFSSTFESALDGEEEPPPWRRASDGEAH